MVVSFVHQKMYYSMMHWNHFIAVASPKILNTSYHSTKEGFWSSFIFNHYFFIVLEAKSYNSVTCILFLNAHVQCHISSMLLLLLLSYYYVLVVITTRYCSSTVHLLYIDCTSTIHLLYIYFKPPNDVITIKCGGFDFYLDTDSNICVREWCQFIYIRTRQENILKI